MGEQLFGSESGTEVGSSVGISGGTGYGKPQYYLLVYAIVLVSKTVVDSSDGRSDGEVYSNIEVSPLG